MRLHWGVGIAATYLVFAGATAGFVAFAMQQRVELVRPDYYTYSLAHDARRRAEARTAALGTRFYIDADTAPYYVSACGASHIVPQEDRYILSPICKLSAVGFYFCLGPCGSTFASACRINTLLVLFLLQSVANSGVPKGA